MRVLSTAAIEALQARHGEFRWLIWITGKNRETGDPASAGFWTGFEQSTIQVVTASGGGLANRTYYAAGALLEVSGITGSPEIEAKAATVRLAGPDAQVEQVLRGYEPRQGQIEIHLGIFTPGTSTPVEAPRPAFFGFVDHVEWERAAEGDFGAVTLSCESHSRELNRSNHDLRSHQSQILRSATDTFYRYTPAMSQRTLYWGKFGGPIKDGGNGFG